MVFTFDLPQPPLPNLRERQRLRRSVPYWRNPRIQRPQNLDSLLPARSWSRCRHSTRSSVSQHILSRRPCYHEAFESLYKYWDRMQIFSIHSAFLTLLQYLSLTTRRIELAEDQWPCPFDRPWPTWLHRTSQISERLLPRYTLFFISRSAKTDMCDCIHTQARRNKPDLATRELC
ncbi:hypothetical protein B0J14DRAFT_250597 [Halenospora varia]|nr:hypothetical protein B0J14DRAFT_250597 [Halenospora varia]